MDTSDAEPPDPALSSRALVLLVGGLLVGVQVEGRVEAASFKVVAALQSPALGVDLPGSVPVVVVAGAVFVGTFAASGLLIFAGAFANTGLAGFC